MHTETSVKDRYSKAATAREAALCCPVDYDPQYLQIIPQEVIERDYGCGDPSKYVREGETVLDLGSGTGKICFIASQVVGESGKVIGVDMTDDMLEIARSAAPVVAERLGYGNVEFLKGKIQDLKTDRQRVESYLKENPIQSGADLERFEKKVREESEKMPLIADNSIDVVVSNCVLNLVGHEDRKRLFSEIFRVLKKGGRAVISDIVSDEIVPQDMQKDPELWSGCISGAFQEEEFLEAFRAEGFYGLEILKRDEKPWQTVEGIEFRSMTVAAYKGKEGACWEHGDALVYKGPFSKVYDDDGHVFYRGERTAVCRKTLEIMSREPYSKFFDGIQVLASETHSEPTPFRSNGRERRRHPSETKGQDYKVTTDSGSCC